MKQHELVVDNFAGGGGASTGIETALGRAVDFAINHDPEAIAMHRVNHPHTRHFCENVWDINPRELVRGRRVGLGWFSPDCTYHSKARGGKPFRDRNRARRVRGLAWLVPRWIQAVRPRVIMLENVEEFADWGPLLEDGTPCPRRRGLTFRRWHRQIENLGYQIDMRELVAAHYGAPTNRKRLFVIARCDGREIVFPQPTHGPFRGGLPYRTAAECIDWSIPCPSIFDRSRPLAEATLRRIARGVMRYVVNNPKPFIVQYNGGDGRVQSVEQPLNTVVASPRFGLVVPSLINTRNGEREGQAPRVRSIKQPLPTVTAQGSQGALVAAFLGTASGPAYSQKPRPVAAPLHTITADSRAGVVAAFLARHYGGNENDGAALTVPMHTITTKDHHALVHAFLVAYYGNDKEGGQVSDPLRTITTKERFGLVMVHGEPHYIVDIGMRMLEPRELYLAQSFPSSYIIDHGIDEHGERVKLTKGAQIHMCGNSVPPAVSEALVRANVLEQVEEAAVA